MFAVVVGGGSGNLNDNCDGWTGRRESLWKWCLFGSIIMVLYGSFCLSNDEQDEDDDEKFA